MMNHISSIVVINAWSRLVIFTVYESATEMRKKWLKRFHHIYINMPKLFLNVILSEINLNQLYIHG